MIAYFDTSAVVKLLIEEPGSDSALRVWQAADARMCATVGRPEAAASLARAARTGRLTDTKLQVALAELTRLWGTLHRSLVDDALAFAASHIALVHELRGYDAVHLAAAIASADTFVAADQRLLAAARTAGLAVADVAA